MGQATDPVIPVLKKEEKPDVQSNSCSNISYGSAKKADAFSEIGFSIQNGLSEVGAGLKAIASSLSSHQKDDIIHILKELKQERAADQEHLLQIRNSLENGGKIQLAMLQALERLAPPKP